MSGHRTSAPVCIHIALLLQAVLPLVPKSGFGSAGRAPSHFHFIRDCKVLQLRGNTLLLEILRPSLLYTS